MDGVTLSRIETEWLVAWFYDRSRLMPSQVHVRLISAGFIEGDNLTAAGRRWLCTGPHTTPKHDRRREDGPGGGDPSHDRRDKMHGSGS